MNATVIRIANPEALLEALKAWHQENEDTAGIYPQVEMEGNLAFLVGTVDAREANGWETADLHGEEIRIGEHETGFVIAPPAAEVETIDAAWMSNSGLLQHHDNPSQEELQAAARSLKTFLEEVEGAEWKGGDRWAIPAGATDEWLEALNHRPELRWPEIA